MIESKRVAGFLGGKEKEEDWLGAAAPALPAAFLGIGIRYTSRQSLRPFHFF